MDEEAVNDAPTPQQQVVVVPPGLMKEVLDKLQDDLPMKSVRNIVLALEQCPIMNVNMTNDAGPDSNSD